MILMTWSKSVLSLDLLLTPRRKWTEEVPPVHPGPWPTQIIYYLWGIRDRLVVFFFFFRVPREECETMKRGEVGGKYLLINTAHTVSCECFWGFRVSQWETVNGRTQGVSIYIFMYCVLWLKCFHTKRKGTYFVWNQDQGLQKFRSNLIFCCQICISCVIVDHQSSVRKFRRVLNIAFPISLRNLVLNQEDGRW